MFKNDGRDTLKENSRSWLERVPADGSRDNLNILDVEVRNHNPLNKIGNYKCMVVLIN